MQTLVAGPILEQIHTHEIPHAMDKHPKTGAQTSLPYLPKIGIHVGPTWILIGIHAPCHMGRAWGSVPWAPHGLGSLPRSGMGLGRFRVSRVAYISCRLPHSLIPTRFREGHCKFIVCTTI